jgi:hypothetical protein
MLSESPVLHQRSETQFVLLQECLGVREALILLGGVRSHKN